jgi:hypothetical protein
MREAEEGGAIVEGDEVGQLQLHLDDGLLDHDVLATDILQVDVHEGHLELFALLVVVHDHLVELVLHEACVRLIRGDLLLGEHHLRLVYRFVHLVIINDVPYLADVCLSRGNDLDEVRKLHLCSRLVYGKSVPELLSIS